MSGIPVTEYRRGEPLFVKGHPAREMYFIVTGTVEIIDGSRIERLSTGGVVGAVEFLRQIPYRTSALCATKTSVIALNDDNLVEFLQSQPQLGVILIKSVAAQVPNDVEGENAVQQEPKQQLPKELMDLLPAGHPTSEEQRPVSDEEFLYAKAVECPVCSTAFSVLSIRESRLITKEVCPDFRIINENFEPLWYHVWVCPSCLYAQSSNQFEKIRSIAAGKIRGLQQRYPLRGTFQFSSSRTLTEVFLSYFLMLRTLEMMDAPPVQYGNTWLRLLWLYEDLGERNWAKQAAEKALKYFEEAIMSGVRSEAEDQRLFIIMAELCLRLDKPNDSIRYLREVVGMRGGNERYKRQASDRIQDLRSS